MWPVWLLDSKIDRSSRINRWNELIFLHAGANSGKLKVISVIFGLVWSKMGIAILFIRPKNLLNECTNLADFLQADCDAIIFG